MGLTFRSLKEYEEILKIIGETHKILPLIEYLNCVEQGEKNLVCLRHDIDYSLKFLPKIIEVEDKLNIKSTIFVLHSIPEFIEGNLDILVELQKKNYEIGFHYAALSYELERGIPAKINFGIFLDKLRSYGLKIYGCASHGDLLARQHNYANYAFFDFGLEHHQKTYKTDETALEIDDFQSTPLVLGESKLEDFSLKYEAYFIPYDIYISESGAKWSIDPIEFFKSGKAKEKNVQILVHPCWWRGV